VRRYTGDSTPYEFPVRPIRLVQDWPRQDNPPFKREDFFRTDNNSDSWFYSVPKLVYHIDEPAVAALTQYYRNNIPPKSDILDICSSWVSYVRTICTIYIVLTTIQNNTELNYHHLFIHCCFPFSLYSHYPLEFPKTMNKICATGISAMELQFNDQLTGGYQAVDLNSPGDEQPRLPYPDASFDVVTCVVSIDYMIQPIAVLREVNRVLRPGGKLTISQSNRCFPTKAINIWLNTNDRQHLELINGFLQYAGGYQEPRQAFDITATLPDNNSQYRDPMFIVQAIKA
jgi:SAM-dependent methyltransferase